MNSLPAVVGQPYNYRPAQIPFNITTGINASPLKKPQNRCPDEFVRFASNQESKLMKLVGHHVDLLPLGERGDSLLRSAHPAAFFDGSLPLWWSPMTELSEAITDRTIQSPNAPEGPYNNTLIAASQKKHHGSANQGNQRGKIPSSLALVIPYLFPFHPPRLFCGFSFFRTHRCLFRIPCCMDNTPTV